MVLTAKEAGDLKVAGILDRSGEQDPEAGRFLAPVELTFYLVVCWYVALFLLSSILQSPIQLIEHFHFGLDHVDFLRASQDLVSGLNPYDRARLVTPPASILLNLPLAGLADRTAANIFFALNLAMLLGAAIILIRCFDLPFRRSAALILLILISPGGQFVLERGNLDAILLFLLCCALCRARGAATSGVLLGFAAGLKVYPLAFAAPLLATRELRAALVAVAVAVGLTLTLPCLVDDFAANHLSRSSMLRLSENISAFAILSVGAAPFGLGEFWLPFGVLLITAVAGIGLWYDRRLSPLIAETERQLLIASYAVFCISFPPLVYLYTSVVLFPLLAAASARDVRLSRAVAVGLAISASLVFFPAQSLALTAARTDADLVHLLPPLGSVGLLCTFIALRVSLWRQSTP